MKTNTITTRSFRGLILTGLMAGLVGGSAAFAQGEDEWFDPTDWFDGNNIEAIDADDTYELEYDFGDVPGADWSSYGTWGTDVWDPLYYDAGFWGDFGWFDSTDTIGDDDLVRTYTYAIYTPLQAGQQASSSSQQSSTNQQRSGSSSQQQSAQASSNQSKGSASSSSQQAGQPTGRMQSDSTSQMSQSQAGLQGQSLSQLDGTIEGLRNMQLKQSSGATGSYTLANIRLEGGNNTVVNLGRSSQLESLNLKKGDSIQALGHRGTIGEETVFVAVKLKAGGQTIDANPIVRLSGTQSTSQQNQTVTGTVAKVNRSTIGVGQNAHTLLDLKLENGQSTTVTLGPAASLEKIGLEEGDTVTIRGQTKQMNGQQVLVPDLMKIDGEKVSSISK